MTSLPSRDPGAAIKSALKREVNFGCPVRFPDGTGCGCPVLTYHHFDPPWVGNFVHNPDGMIALCKWHHDLADGGGFTMAQLRAMKRAPYVDDAVKVQWPYSPETLVVKISKSLVIGDGSPIRLNTKPILAFRPEPIEAIGGRTVVFDADIRDAAGNPWLTINDSWFDLRLAATTDVAFPPQARTLIARHSDSTFISLRHRRMRFGEIGAWLSTFLDKQEMVHSGPSSIKGANAIDSDGMVPILELEGHFRTADVEVRILGNEMVFRSFIPGMEEEFPFHSWIVNGTNRVRLLRPDKSEFFSLG